MERLGKLFFFVAMSKTGLVFPQDKNYILKEVQEDTKTALLKSLVKASKDTYLTRHNPLGLEDDTIRVIKECRKFSLANLESFYQELAAIYRYKIGSNQLEFLFSGKSHYEKYLDDWSEVFEIWTEDFVTSTYFIKAVLEIAILRPENREAFLAKNRLKVMLTQYFRLKVYRYRGIIPIKAA